MIRIFLVTSLCFFSGCAFLDDDLLLDDDEFEESFEGGYGTSGYGYSSGSYSSRCGSRTRVGRMSMGSPIVGNYGISGIREFEFDGDDIEGHFPDSMSAGDDTDLDQEEIEVEEVFEDWHAEFLRTEEGWLRAEDALAQRGDKEASN